MVKMIMGHKGSGKTKRMIELANEKVEKSQGNVIYINKNHRLTYDLKYRIRVICMEDFVHITNSDEYIGFLYGVLGMDRDVDTVFIDGVLRHADITLGNMPEFIDRLKDISAEYQTEFIVSVSASKEELIGMDYNGCKIIS
ncbi:hypothetical protein GCWU000322_00355 [Eubacterium saphenum ATCC 49989]|nr:hypothetical protein GCWU000322_00355 [Eubacterium saphenum ATCC 49989]